MTTNQDFTPEQKRYLEGFVSGAQTARAGRGLKPFRGTGALAPAALPAPGTEPSGPDVTHHRAQHRFVAEGDSFGVVLANDPELVGALAARLGVEPRSEARDGNGHSRRLDAALMNDVALSPAPNALFELLATLAQDSGEPSKLLAMAQGEDPDGDLETLDVLAALEKFPALTHPAGVAG